MTPALPLTNDGSLPSGDARRLLGPRQPVADGCGDADGGEEVPGEPIVAGCDAAEVLDATEHALNRIAVSVEEGREAVLPFPVRLGRDIGERAASANLLPDGVAVIAFVGMQDGRRRHLLDQHHPGSAIGYLAAGQEKGDRPAESIRQGMDFGGPSASPATVA